MSDTFASTLDLHEISSDNRWLLTLEEYSGTIVITSSDITKSSYNEVILLVPALYPLGVLCYFYPDIMRNLI